MGPSSSNIYSIYNMGKIKCSYNNKQFITSIVVSNKI